MGLACAKVLMERGHEVAVFEASDDIGGRVRTDALDGFLLDRGFQVYYGGIFLERSLRTSARVLRFTFKMLAAGKTTVPERGIGARTDMLKPGNTSTLASAYAPARPVPFG